jgi:hypothetical protein
MNDQDKEYLRDLAAMFKSITGATPQECYKFADEMLEAREPQETVGLPAIKKRTRK